MDHLRSAKLTKRYLLSLPGGIFVMSNLVDDLVRPLFSEHVVSPVSAHEKQ
jgi:hypothetical protein